MRYLPEHKLRSYSLSLDDELVARIDDFSRLGGEPLSRSEMVRQLCEFAICILEAGPDASLDSLVRELVG